MSGLFTWLRGFFTGVDPALKHEADKLNTLVIRVKPTSTTKIVVEWAEPNDQHSRLIFRISEAECVDFTKKEHDQGRKRIVFGDLQPTTTYFIQVKDRDAEGLYYSDPMYATTKPSADESAAKKEYVCTVKLGNYFVSPLSAED